MSDESAPEQAAYRSIEADGEVHYHFPVEIVVLDPAPAAAPPPAAGDSLAALAEHLGA